MTSKKPPQAPVHTISQIENIIRRIERQINRLKEININTINDGNDARIAAESNNLGELLCDIYGYDTPAYTRYWRIHHLQYFPLTTTQRPHIEEIRSQIKKNIESAIIHLETIKESLVEKINDSKVHGSTLNAIKAYQGLDLHPKIAEVANQRYHDGHYADAILNSVIALNELVREKSGIGELDGVRLMQKVFSVDNPILKFNNFADQNDKEEQKGFMHLCMGAVSGLRNPRAHKIINDDPVMTLKFIAFISLLAEMVEAAKN